MIPTRISLITYNLWNTEKWPEREPALRNFLRLMVPDIMCVQELRPETLACISDAMPTHAYVADDLPGWTVENNIFWNKDYFAEVEHGREEFDRPEHENHRGLFWVRLKLSGSDKTILVGTAHFTYQGHPSEIETGTTFRNKQTRQTIEHLNKLAKKDEPIFFMGDLNDPVIPNRLFNADGFWSCFHALGQICPPTFPAQPITTEVGFNQAVDWVFSKGEARAVSASVPKIYCEGVGVSDHWPIHAIYELTL